MTSAPPAPKKSKRSEIDINMVDISDDEMDSPFTLYFVNLPDGSQAEKRNLEEVFKIAKKAGLMPEYMDSKAMECLESSDDSFVISCFRGKMFNGIRKKNIKIYGPPIIFECIQEGKQLPHPGHPVYSSVFDGARICFTSVEPERKQSLRNKIFWMGGQITECLCPESTHLVAGIAKQTGKYKAAVKNSIPLIRTDWIDDLWETSQTTMGKFSGLMRDALISYKLRVFEGLEMAVTSIDGCDRSSLIQLIEDNGGHHPGNMSRTRCSHLITDKTSGEKYAKATEWKTIPIVQTRWIRKCIELGHLLDEVKYHPKYLSIDRFPSTSSVASSSNNPKRDSSDGFLSPEFTPSSHGARRLSGSTFNLSSALTSLDQTIASLASSKSYTSGNRRSGGGERKSGQFPSPPPRSSAPLVRHSTNQSISDVPVADAYDPIDDIRKKIDEEHGELFENCLFHICGVEDKTRLEKWRRFLNETGATRAPNIESATHVVVVNAPKNQQEKTKIRKLQQQDEDISVVTVQWVVECVKKRELVNGEDFEWTENAVEDSQ